MKRLLRISGIPAILCGLLLGACSEGESQGLVVEDTTSQDVESVRAEDPSVTGAPQSDTADGEVATGRDDVSTVGIATGVSGDALQSSGGVDYSLVPTLAPDFEWKNVDGSRESLSDYRGSVVLVNFWGTWCPPCRRELPDIVSIRDEYRSRGFEVIGVAVNERPSGGMSVPEHLASFAAANDLRYPMVIDNFDVSAAFGQPSSVPTTFVIDRRGQVVDVMVGAKTAAEFRAAIDPHL